MKKLGSRLLAVVIGIAIGWTFSYLQLPVVEESHAFWIGFAAALATVTLLAAILFSRKKNTRFYRLITGNDPSSVSGVHKTLWVMVFLFILVGGISGTFMILRQNEFLKQQAEEQNKRIREQSELIESERNSNKFALLNNVLNKVDDELKNSPDRSLSSSTIARIEALNHSFKPYRYISGDSLTSRKWSPERGQLLTALAYMNIDSASFAKILNSISFSMADLQGADLRRIDLRGIDLKGANLQDARLQGVNLSGANLTGANLWGADLRDAKLERTVFRKANMEWTKLDNSNLKLANLNGVKLTSAKIHHANLQGVTLHYSDLIGAMLNEADLTGADFGGANLTKVNLSNANMFETRLRLANLSEANITGAKLFKIAVEEDWYSKLDTWKITGGKFIRDHYKVQKDTSARFVHDDYFLKKTE